MILRRTLFIAILTSAIGFIVFLGLILYASYARVRTWQFMQQLQNEVDREKLLVGETPDYSDYVQRTITERKAGESVVQFTVMGGIGAFPCSLTFKAVGYAHEAYGSKKDTYDR